MVVEHGAHRDAVDHSGACVPFHPATLICLSCLAAKKIVCAGNTLQDSNYSALTHKGIYCFS